MGRIITISGPRGVGKTTIIDVLRDSHDISPIVPFTTRDMRDSEVDGHDYNFVDPAAFDALQSRSPMFDVLTVKGNRYGTPLYSIDDALESDQTRTFNLAAQTALRLRKYGAGLVASLMILPAAQDDIREQMRVCGTSEDEIEARIRHEPTDLTLVPQFDHVVYNRRNELDKTIDETLRYIKSLG